MVVHAAPKTQPGGVQGAFDKPLYQSDGTPLLVNSPPIASAPKFSTKKNYDSINHLYNYFNNEGLIFINFF